MHRAASSGERMIGIFTSGFGLSPAGPISNAAMSSTAFAGPIPRILINSPGVRVPSVRSVRPVREQITGDIKRCRASGTRPEKERQKLNFGQRGWPFAKQLLAWAVFRSAII